MLIDTHCHLHDREFFSPDQAEAMLARARAKGVEQIICIGTNPEDSATARSFAEAHKNVFWTYGIHPESATGDGHTVERGDDYCTFFKTIPQRTSEEEAASARNDGAEERRVEKKVNNCVPRSTDLPVAIGEIGLDYHYEGYDRTVQIKLFEQMLQLALDLNLPVSLHIREAFADAFSVLDNFPATRGVVHSFTGSKQQLKQFLVRDFYIGVNGLATYTTPALPPLEKMVLETDAPFLTPVPFRGTINEPSYVREVATYLSGKLGVALAEIEEQTTQNARKIFQIRP